LFAPLVGQLATHGRRRRWRARRRRSRRSGRVVKATPSGRQGRSARLAYDVRRDLILKRATRESRRQAEELRLGGATSASE